jgi:hypothetical protein
MDNDRQMVDRDYTFELPPPTPAETMAAARAAAVTADAWRRRNSMLVCTLGGAWLVVSLLLTHLLPNSWDHDSGAWSEFVTGMLRIVPSIEKWAVHSPIKGVTEAYLAITWTLVIVTVGSLTFRQWPLDARTRIPVAGRWVVFWLLVLVIVAFSIGQFIGYHYIPRRHFGYSLSATMLVSWSRLALALFGTVLYVVQSIILTAAFVVARNFRRLWLQPATGSR